MKVFIVSPDRSTEDMFSDEGFTLVSSPDEADFLCFTGGEDVSPELYGQTNTGLSFTNPSRDKLEVSLFKEYRKNHPMVGICRGGQLLNVLHGGSMIQDIPRHTGVRRVFFRDSERSLLEDHHQAMIPGVGATIVGMDTDGTYEILTYPNTLCFQAHPEWGHNETKDVFFLLLNELLNNAI